jgi:hypothetical protein
MMAQRSIKRSAPPTLSIRLASSRSFPALESRRDEGNSDDTMSCTKGGAVTKRPAGSSAEALATLLRTGARAVSTV